GLCYMSLGVNPLLSNLCRVDGGQMAGTAFIFINMAMYLGSFLVCLKMWRHEAARRERESHDARVIVPRDAVAPLTLFFSLFSFDHLAPGDERDTCPSQPGPGPGPEAPEGPARVHVVADYLIKYPQIRCPEERETYAAVFNDQYQEYKDLHRDVASTLSRFRQLDLVMSQLLREGGGPQEQQRIQSLLRTYQEKKQDPSFLEKKERCGYLKAKLSHIKNRIRTFD
uniref:OCEL domain-containing protein n=1 Tax=Tetraodon nigroviridis TaxID=99883 RepID=H3D0F7_TETNG